MTTIDAATVKACCATVYGTDLVRLFLDDSYHPGGAALSRRLADLLDLKPDEHVLDVAAGLGTTAVLLAAERGTDMVGVDLGASQVARARRRADQAGLADKVSFELGDAEQLPPRLAGFDAVVCECAFCTFPDKATAAGELARVVRPGGRVGIADVWLEPDRLDPDLRGLAGRVACLADARPIPELTTILESAGLTVTRIERHDDALAATIDQIIDRLRAVRILGRSVLGSFDVTNGIDLARRAAHIVARGDAGYVLVAARKG